MASDIGVKMGVSGVSSFKSQMNAAKSSVKALDAELKLNAAQYKAGGDSEEYMANRAKILADQIKQQEGVVAAAQKALETMASEGVDKASTSYTQMQAALAKAKTDLVNMQAAANDASGGLESVSESADTTADSLKSIDSGIKFQNITSALDKVESKMKSILTAAINIGKTVWDWGKDAASWADDLATTAARAGLDVETYQRYDYAAKIIDTDVDTITKASDKLRAATYGAEGGVALITQGTTQFGIAVKDAEGNTRDQADMLWDFIEILGQVENETDRNALAQEYFGKSYREMTTLIQKGKGEWDKAAESATVVSQENVDALTQWADKYDELNNQWETTKYTLLANLAPAFEKVADALEYMMGLLNEWAESQEGQDAMQRIGDAVASLITSFAEGGFEKIFEGATSAIEKISQFLSEITGDDITDGLAKIAGIFAGMKLSAEFIKGLTLMKAVGLGGASKAGAASSAASTATTLGLGSKVLLGLQHAAEGAVMGAMSYHVTREILGATKEEAKKWSTLTGIGTLINPFLGGGLFVSSTLLGGHATGDQKDYIYSNGVADMGYSVNGKQLYMNAYGKIVTGDQVKYSDRYGVDMIDDPDYTPRLDYGYKSLNGLAQSGEFNALYDEAFEDAISAWAQWGDAPAQMQQAVKEFDDGSGVLVTLTENGELYMQALEDVNAFFDEFNAEMQSVEGMDYTTTGASAGEELSESFVDGALENYAAAYGAGAALGAAFAAGASSAQGGGSNTTYNSEFVNSVNVYGAQSPAEIAAAYRSYMQQRQAGYGG